MKISTSTWQALSASITAHMFGFTQCELDGNKATVPKRKLVLRKVWEHYT